MSLSRRGLMAPRCCGITAGGGHGRGGRGSLPNMERLLATVQLQFLSDVPNLTRSLRFSLCEQ